MNAARAPIASGGFAILAALTLLACSEADLGTVSGTVSHTVELRAAVSTQPATACGEMDELVVEVTNHGDEAVSLATVDFVEDQPGLQLIEVPPLPLRLERGQSASIRLGQMLTAGPAPAAAALLGWNDGQRDRDLRVSISGRAVDCQLSVSPGVIDFGVLEPGAESAPQTITIENTGALPFPAPELRVDPGGYTDIDNFLHTGWDDPSVLAPNEIRTLSMRFVNHQDSKEEATAWLRVTTPSQALPDYAVALHARRLGLRDCQLQIVPATITFATPPTPRFVSIVSIGSGPCRIHHVALQGCPGLSCSAELSGVSITGTPSEHFELLGQLPDELVLDSGEALDLAIGFKGFENLGAGINSFGGLLAVAAEHEAIDGSTPIMIPQQADEPNVTMVTTPPSATVHNQSVDFGLVQVGCLSSERVVGVEAFGVWETVIEGWSTDCPSLQLQWPNDDDEPVVVEAATSVDIPLRWAAEEIGPVACSLWLTVNGVAETIAVTAEGTPDSHIIDTFPAQDIGKVDILWVVDDSGSMAEEQTSVANGLTAFAAAAAEWESHFHMGVVSTDMKHLGQLRGQPPYVVPSDIQLFVDNVQIGVLGSMVEKGVDAAVAALSGFNVQDTGEPCATDSGCLPPYACVQGYCGGPNRGFHRNHVALEIIFLSDEDDHGYLSADTAEAVFREAAGTAPMHVHAIVGPPEGCESETGKADPGTKYLELAARTGGIVSDICNDDIGGALLDIGEVAFGGWTTFFLTATPANPGDIQVYVDGLACPEFDGESANWEWKPQANAIDFALDSPCMPPQGGDVTVEFEQLCL